MTAVLLLLLAGWWLWHPELQLSDRTRQISILGSGKFPAPRAGAQQQALALDAQIIRELAALMRSGLMFPQAIEALLQVRTEQSPVLAALRRLKAQATFRGEQAEAMEHTGEHEDRGPVQRLSWCLDLSSQTGAPLAGVLDQLAEDLEAELLARQSFDAAMAGPRATTRLLTWLPVVGLGAGFILGIDVGTTLLTSWPAQLSLAVGAGLWALNRIWCRRLLAATTAQALQ
ncbi:type II secretion system F family protein [Glutamicibacter soli]